MVCSSSALALTAMVVAYICSLQTSATMAKTLHITHYTHEIRGGSNSTLLLVGASALPNAAEGVGFGSLFVYDNTITARANRNSQMLGRASGTASMVVLPSSTPDNKTRVQIVMQHIFGEASKYNGSFINVVGIFYYLPPWEMPVSGAIGLLRGYTGYAICQLISESIGVPPLFVVYKWDFYLTKKEKEE